VTVTFWDNHFLGYSDNITICVHHSIIKEKIMEKAAQMITGQCHCGSVKYEAQGPILRQGSCSCRGCQKATGALTSPNVGVPMETFKITSGTPTVFKASSGVACDTGVYHFCNQCGSQLYWIDAAKTEIAIFAGTLDDTSLFKTE